jgi:hypothetical protein
MRAAIHPSYPYVVYRCSISLAAEKLKVTKDKNYLFIQIMKKKFRKLDIIQKEINIISRV